MGVEVHYSMKSGLKDVDIVMMLRLQTERMQGLFVPSISEYFHFFGLDHEKLKFAKPDALIMHPGPMNRGVEIDLGGRRRPRPLGHPRAGRDGRGGAHGLPRGADRRAAQRAGGSRRVRGNVDRSAPQHSGSTAYINARIIDPATRNIAAPC